MKYYIIAGEASGDLHASNLMQQLKLQDTAAEFRFFGGDLMQAQGGTLVKHYRAMAFMGFIEVLFNLNQIFANLAQAKKDLLAYKPDVVILVDFPGFNLRIAEYAKSLDIKVVYYISPKVWAWNTKRVEKIKRIVDLLLVILPFEVDFYKKHNYAVTYIGNPLMDAIAQHKANETFRAQNNLSDKPILALLPGSRKQEITRLLPVMIETAAQFPEYECVIAGAPAFEPSFYTPYIHANSKLVFNQTYDLLHHASGALVASGTATLETALFNVPQVVCYKGNPLTIAIGRLLIKIKYISLVNLIMDKPVVEEFIQNDCTSQHLTSALLRILPGSNGNKLLRENYQELRNKVGEAGASKRAATAIIHFLQ